MKILVFTLRTGSGETKYCVDTAYSHNQITDLTTGEVQYVVVEDDGAYYDRLIKMTFAEFDAHVEGLFITKYLPKPETVPGPRKPVPAVPPEIWVTPPKDMDYMAAVRAMCGDGT